MGLKRRRQAIVEASVCEDAEEAVRLLQPSVLKQRTGSALTAVEVPDAKHRTLLGGVLLRAGRVDDAAAVLVGEAVTATVDPVDAIVLDPDYNGMGGHQHQSDRFYRAAASEAGFSVAVLLPFGFPSPEADLPGARQTFRQLTPQQLFQVPPDDAVLAALNGLYLRQFRRILPERRPRLLVVPTLTAYFAEALLDYLTATDGSDATSLLLAVHDASWADGDRQRPRGVYRRTFDKIAGAKRIRPLIAAETDAIAAGLRQFVGGRIPVAYAPGLGTLVDVTPAERDPTARPTIGFLGRSSPDRGGDLIPDIADLTSRLRPDLRWLAQLDIGMLRRRGVADMAKLAGLEESGVMAVTGHRRSRNEYLAMLRNVGVMVLPLDRSYQARASAIGADAIRSGCVLVAPEGSAALALAEELGGGFAAFAERDPAEIAAAIVAAVDRYPALSRRAADAATAFANHPGLGQVRRFVEAA